MFKLLKKLLFYLHGFQRYGFYNIWFPSWKYNLEKDTCSLSILKNLSHARVFNPKFTEITKAERPDEDVFLASFNCLLH